MKAAFRSKYGSPYDLRITELAIPVAKDNEILVRVFATTVNRTDLGVLSGKPLLMRMFTGLFKPISPITGTDFAGQVTGVGKNVMSFKSGDRVMGFSGVKNGSHAQYITVAETRPMITIPGNLSYDQAVACLEGAFYAFNFVSKLKPQAGQKVLVNGATGAIGSSVVQYLKWYGIDITAVCDAKDSVLVSSLGAAKIIDYKKEDFTKDTLQYDMIIDAVGKSTFSKCKPILKPKGIYTSADGIENALLALITPWFGGKKVVFGILKTPGFFVFIRKLIEEKKFTAVIDRKFSFEKLSEAYTYVSTGQKIGNVIIDWA